MIEAVFKFTAAQEKTHGQVFYQHLKDLAGENIQIDGAYPVDIKPCATDLLGLARHNEYEEFENVYPAFAEKAKEEGFPQIAASFNLIAQIEKIHGDRFALLEDLVKKNQLYVSDVKTGWMCMKCGHVYEGLEPPKKCPVCQADQAYFIRIELTPYTTAKICGLSC